MDGNYSGFDNYVVIKIQLSRLCAHTVTVIDKIISQSLVGSLRV